MCRINSADIPDNVFGHPGQFFPTSPHTASFYAGHLVPSYPHLSPSIWNNLKAFSPFLSDSPRKSIARLSGAVFLCAAITRLFSAYLFHVFAVSFRRFPRMSVVLSVVLKGMCGRLFPMLGKGVRKVRRFTVKSAELSIRNIGTFGWKVPMFFVMLLRP